MWTSNQFAVMANMQILPLQSVAQTTEDLLKKEKKKVALLNKVVAESTFEEKKSCMT